jgi:hypothetical protein
VEGSYYGPGDTLALTADGISYVVSWVTNTTAAISRNDGKIVLFPEVELRNGETFFITGNVTSSQLLGGLNNTQTIVFPGGMNGLEVAAGAASNGTKGGTAGKLNYTFTGAVTALSASVDNFSYPAFHVKEPKDYGSNYELISVASGYEAAGNPSIANVALTGADSGATGMEDDDVVTYVDYFGAYVEKDTPSGDDGDSVTIYVPADQVYANVFLAPLAASISTSSTSGAVSLNPISLGLAILDSEATLGSKPYIVVGGPCANTVAAALMGNGADCAAGFTEGKAMIKLFSDKNALLVAGYSGKDTQAACRVLASYKDPKYALSGTEMEVVTTNLQEPTVRRVSS